MALREVECERGDDVLGHVVLNSEDVGQVSVESLRPDMPASHGVNQDRPVRASP